MISVPIEEINKLLCRVYNFLNEYGNKKLYQQSKNKKHF